MRIVRPGANEAPTPASATHSASVGGSPSTIGEGGGHDLAADDVLLEAAHDVVRGDGGGQRGAGAVDRGAAVDRLGTGRHGQREGDLQPAPTSTTPIGASCCETMAAVTIAKPTKVGSAGRSRRNVAAYSSGSSATRCASSTPPAAHLEAGQRHRDHRQRDTHQVRAGATAVTTASARKATIRPTDRDGRRLLARRRERRGPGDQRSDREQGDAGPAGERVAEADRSHAPILADGAAPVIPPTRRTAGAQAMVSSSTSGTVDGAYRRS